ncbi:JmjC domain-containing histone demethylation protein 1 [Seminavis robusta]|uniref:JmjC domain-containing histone demethylation protein 1 n=1 Tax=Seminavis robusta TaxID=568900 RepID=A0A9N8H6M1_9STRA|nr:JmjC domain-containing histone demethylation protein 1 [Seminavis robusta]|eukprot:Sro104_g052680.1 JmjC domain-containing histone demethylation protein 1 (608) ;mRNA; f:18578-20401
MVPPSQTQPASLHADGHKEVSHANHHVPAFLALSTSNESAERDNGIQVVHDGTQLTAEAFRNEAMDISRPIIVKDTPESIGMTVFRPLAVQEGSEDRVTIRHVADVIGHQWPVRVLDVEHQEELQGWSLGDLVDHFEDEGRLRATGSNRDQGGSSPEICDNSHWVPRRRKAATKASQSFMEHQSRPRILNQISLEFSRTALASRVKSPTFVRDLDWIEQQDKKSTTPVQYYCLTSMAGCFTDFHADFGGTSVWYHVLSGSKMFCLIAPTKENLGVYEEWLGHKDQESTFLPNLIKNPEEVITASLEASQTLFIPTGWIHAVYTPDDAIVLGGNFLHGYDIPVQLAINDIEHRRKVPQRERFPFFREIHMGAAAFYLQKLRVGDYNVIARRELDNIPALLKCLEGWLGETGTMDKGSLDFQAATSYAPSSMGYSSPEQLLRALCQEHEKALASWASISRSTPDKGLSMLAPDSPRDAKFVSDAMTASKEQSATLEVKNHSFRIVISSAAKELHNPLPRGVRKSNPGKECNRYVDKGDDDDDWVPPSEQRNNQRRASGIRLKLSLSGGRSPPTKRKSSVKAAQGSKPDVRPIAKKPKTTSRQRLLKKFR